tara:strand:+ start:186 stop:674 length:489 start_codon:yes stop_codon:yes gene_type:complete
MIFAYILIAIIIIIILVKYFSKDYKVYDYVEEKPIIPTGTNQMPMEVLVTMINETNDILDAHKVFTTKSLSELRIDVDRLELKHKEKTKKDFLTKLFGKAVIKAKKKCRYTDAELHYEMNKKSEGVNLNELKDLNYTLYKSLRNNAYQRLWQRQYYQSKKKK